MNEQPASKPQQLATSTIKGIIRTLFTSPLGVHEMIGQILYYGGRRWRGLRGCDNDNKEKQNHDQKNS
eukprot:2179016-Amphidinium_carterae.1